MKRRVLLFLATGLIFLLFSCTTTNRVVVPDWVFTAPKALRQVVYVGEGIGSSEREAKEMAYEGVLAQMNRDLGTELSSSYKRELIAYDRINELGTKVKDSYTRESDGSYYYYVLTMTPSKTFLSSRSDEYRELLEREAQIEALLEQALSEYKDNEDIKSVNTILSAVCVSLSGAVNNPEYTPDALTDRALEILSNLKIAFKRERGDTSEVEVRLIRYKGLFHPRVENGEIRATYVMENDLGELIESSFICSTGGNGTFYFNKTNPYTVRRGGITFSVNLDQSVLQRLYELNGETILERIFTMIESRGVTHYYEEREKFNVDNTVIAIVEYGLDGAAHSDPYANEIFKEYLSSAGIDNIDIVNGSGDEAEDILNDLLSRYPNKRYFIVIRIGVTDMKESPNLLYYRTEGRLVIYDSDTDQSYMLPSSFSSGSGESKEEAERDAIKIQTRIIAGLFLEEI